MRTTWTLIFATLLAAPAIAQDSEPPMRVDVRQRIEERFAARVREELGLTDQQAARLRETVGSYFVKRRGFEADERRLRQALAGQLRPGVAANPDSVGRITEGLADLKVRYAQTYKDELRELSGYLDPVQRAQFFLMRERLLERVRNVQDERQDARALRRNRLSP
jgi:hypothetical protein